MKKYLLLHVGFEPPTPEIMEAWNKWFASLEDVGVDMGGFSGAKEINLDGIKDLPMDLEAATGFNIIEAENMAEAEKIAEKCPFITSIRVYEIRSM
jgi:hypothetical protein